MRGRIRVYLDGPREAELNLPDNWEYLSSEARKVITAPYVEEILANSLAVDVAWEDN